MINLLGLAGASNATGDDQKKLDVLGNQIFLDTMKNCGKVGVIVSEEEENVIIIKGHKAKYAVVCDPIDGILSLLLDCSDAGSSNLDAGVSVGTIFGIYRIPDEHIENPTVADVLRPGTDMVVAGYCTFPSDAVDYRYVCGKCKFSSYEWQWRQWIYFGQCTWRIHPHSS